MGGPTTDHQRREQLLRTVAALTGCTIFLGQLTDGRRPDLIAVDPERRRLFIGDAKATEHAGSSASAARLFRYLAWLGAAHRAAIDTSFLLCCPTRTARTWALEVELLLAQARLTGWAVVVDKIGTDALVSARPWMP